MATASSGILQQYQQPLWGRLEPALRNCFVGSGIIGLVLMIIVLVVPIPVLKPVTVAQVPERLARLILEKPVHTRPTAKAGGGGGGGGNTESTRPGTKTLNAPPPVEVARPANPAAPPARRIGATPKVASDRGVQGRQRATTEVAANLANVTGSLDKVLDGLAKQAPAGSASASRAGTGAAPSASSDGARVAVRGRRGVRAGRGTGQLSSVGGVSNLSSADLSGSAIAGEGVSIGMITDLVGGSAGAGLGGTGDGTGGGSGGGSGGGIGTGIGNGVGSGQGGGAGSGSGGGYGDGIGNGRGSGPGSSAGGNDYRSNESLLAVVRRYAPGIQFCYDNELRKTPGLRGKLVVSLTVLANGSVSEVGVVEDSLHSPSVRDCVLAQIRGWQFPAVPSGVTSFKTPFVFTPPN